MTRSRGKDTWYVPGGKREAGESDHQALIREVFEETTVSLMPPTIRYYGSFIAQAHGKPEGVMVKMTCYTAEFKGDLKPSQEIEAIGYFGYELYPSLGPVDQLIFGDLLQKHLIC